jgi:GNAT superfamily N-acetyltransferase
LGVSEVDLAIRKAKSEDLETVVDVYCESFVPMVRGYHEDIDDSLTNRANLTSMWQKILEDESNSVFLAALPGATSPSAVLAFKQSSEPQTIELAKLFVVPLAQSSGLARSFYEFGETFAIEQGCSKIELWTWEISHQSRRFYEKVGFTASTERGLSGYPGVKPENDVTMRYVKRIA